MSTENGICESSGARSQRFKHAALAYLAYGILYEVGSIYTIYDRDLPVQGLGIMLPNEIRVFRQLVSDAPDVDLISRLGMRNARLCGVQGIFQLGIIFVMANLRGFWG